MKKLILFAFIVFIGFQSFGQTSSASEEELVKSYFKLSKKALFEANMNMSEASAKAFWPLYNKFETEAGKLQDDRITFLKEYAENFENITNEQADEFVKKVFQYRKKMLALKMKYYKQIKKATNALVATRFLEIEQYVQTAVRYEIMEALPFVGDNDM